MAAGMAPVVAAPAAGESSTSGAVNAPVGPHLDAPAEPPRAGTLTSPGAHFVCSVEGCGKAYTKRARLLEHERSHTGERPFVCAQCGASYMRASHRDAHARTHQDESQKEFVCEHGGCGKRFWTAQHLRRHTAACHENTPLESQDGAYPCSFRGCERSFSQRKHLRQHIREAHTESSNAALPFVCDVPGCERRFPTNAKRMQHARAHDESRYMCALPHSDTMPTEGRRLLGDDPLGAWTFRTWAELQQHTRICHPPQCPHPTCMRTFANRENLRKHLRQCHAEQAADGQASDGSAPGTLVCSWNGCGRTFSSAYALQTHMAKVHEQEKPFACAKCGRQFGYKHRYQQHVARCGEPTEVAPRVKPAVPLAHLGQLLGPQHSLPRGRVLQCPWPSLVQRAERTVPPSAEQAAMPPAEKTAAPEAEPCQQRFARLYDLRRHLASAHALELSDEELAKVLPDEQLRQLPPPRKRPRPDVT